MKTKQTCKVCDKQMVNLTRHMHMVHDISLSNVREAANLREFIHLCFLAPIPVAKLTKLMKTRQQIEKYLTFETELSRKNMKILKVYFERYQQSNHKLLLSDVVKNRSSTCKKETDVPIPKTDATTNIMKDDESVITQ